MLRLIAVLLLLAMSPARAAERADLALVLAVDASASVDPEEYQLQLSGIAAAFRDPAVLAAIRSGPSRRIAVEILEWADHQVPKSSTGFHSIGSAGEAEAFASVAEAFPRHQNGATGIGEGIAAALRDLDNTDIDASRRVIDVSGDGRETPAREYVVLLPQARAMAYEREVTINGLAITNEDATLADYYRDAVALGADSFVMSVTDYTAFAAAMRRKLIREIQAPAVSLN